MEKKNNPVSWLRQVALVEGVSFLVLLFVAMPLKYFAGMPGAVRVVGWAHGALFVALCALLVWVMVVAKWSVGRGAMVFAGALVPFGPFLIDGKMKRYEEEGTREREAAEVGAA